MIKRLPTAILQLYDGNTSEQLSGKCIQSIPTVHKTHGHCIHHHEVHKNSSTTLIMVVFDSSCKQILLWLSDPADPDNEFNACRFQDICLELSVQDSFSMHK